MFFWNCNFCIYILQNTYSGMRGLQFNEAIEDFGLGAAAGLKELYS